MTIQNGSSDFFDSIVYAESDSKKWLAGSNAHKRTRPFGGAPDETATDTFARITFVYDNDGNVTGYRNGIPYGNPYTLRAPAEFKANEAVVLLGLRHLPNSANKALRGSIDRARLFDRALTAEEVKTGAATFDASVSEEQLLAAMTADQKEYYSKANHVISQIEQQVKELAPPPGQGQKGSLEDLALAIINMKEFIYIR